MELLLYLLFVFIGLALGHAVGKARERITITVAEPSHQHGQLHGILDNAARHFVNRMRPHQPRNLLGYRKPFELVKYRGGLSTRYFETLPNDDWMHEPLTSEDIKSGDPDGKVAAAMRRLADKVLRDGRPRIFFISELPLLLDFAAHYIDEDTNCVVRLIRGYDVTQGIFVTQVSL